MVDIKRALLSVFTKEENIDTAVEYIAKNDTDFEKKCGEVCDFEGIICEYIDTVYTQNDMEKRLFLVRLAHDFVNLETGGGANIISQDYTPKHTEVETKEPCLVGVEKLMIENEACLVRLKERE